MSNLFRACADGASAAARTAATTAAKAVRLTGGQRTPPRVLRVPSTARVLLDFLSRPERHSYASHRWARADLHVPDGAGPFPVVVVLHGGYWRARYSKRTM